mmetsp:Transcript_25577/g.29216  ORF Transcript_25577/g.29216 Transcript_25577/m.29216 type:complete len:307 (+) Transcript_25577:90-1010(+)
MYFSMKFIPTVGAVLILTTTTNTLAFLHSSSSFNIKRFRSSTPFTSISSSSSTSLNAQKKRRRRKDGDKKVSQPTSFSSPPEATNVTPPPPSILTDDDELPDFDLDDEENNSKSTVISPNSLSEMPSIKRTSSPRKEIDLNDPAVLAAMKASSSSQSLAAASSTKDLLRSRNRELESKLVVDKIVEDVPSLADYTQKRGNTGGGGSMGKKAMKRQERRAVALEAESNSNVDEGENILGSLLEKLPFVDSTNDGEKKTTIKLLEEGTWACIYILVGWEIFINSPLFQRAAPLAPVVYSDPVTMTFLI